MTAFEWKTFFVWRVTYICVHVTQAQFLPTSSKHVSPGMRFRGRHFSNPQNTYVSWRLLPNPSNSQDTSGTFGPQDQNLLAVGKCIC